MYVLLLVSGAAFVAAGAVLGAQARIVGAGVIPRVALVLLAAFAVTQGASEWVDMATDIESGRGGGRGLLAGLHLVLLAVSFALLLGFALAVHRSIRRRSPFIPTIGIVALAAWILGLGAVVAGWPGIEHAPPPGSREALTRWLLGLPASACAASGLIALARSLEAEDWAMARLVRAAGYVFLVYGAAVAATVTPGLLHPEWPFSTGDLGQHLGITVEVFRTVSGVAIAFLLSEAFVFLVSQRLRREETCLRDDFIALVTHELGNPLAALELVAERVERCDGAVRAVDARLTEDVEACALTLRRLVMDLLDTSRIHAHQLEIRSTVVHLAPVLARAAEVASAGGHRAPGVAVECPDSVRAVLADPARLDQIVSNLLTNASKYSRPGTPILIAADARGREVVVRVVNEGPCIRPADAARIFSRHYRSPSARRGAAPGLGLGLYVVRGLVEAQGGRIWVESHDERTAFCFTLPRAPETADCALEPHGRTPVAQA